LINLNLNLREEVEEIYQLDGHHDGEQSNRFKQNFFELDGLF